MKTILTTKIDGYDIVTAFSEPSVDPVNTQKNVVELLKKTDEYKAVEALKAEYAEIVKARTVAFSRAAQLRPRPGQPDSPEYIKAVADYHVCIAQIAVQEKKLKAAGAELIKKRDELTNANLVYFKPKAGELIVSEDEAAKYKSLMADKIAVTVDYKTVEDNRGGVYFKDCKPIHIDKLGVKIPKGAKTYDELSGDERLKADYLTLPSNEQKIFRKNIIDRLTREAAIQKAELELAGDKSALSKAQEWLKAETARIENLLL